MVDSATVVSTGNQIVSLVNWIYPIIISLIMVIIRHPIDKVTPGKGPKKVKAEPPKA